MFDSDREFTSPREEDCPEKRKRVKPNKQSVSPLGLLIQRAMQLLGLSYQQLVSQSNLLAEQNQNSDMRIGKSTLGNIINGSIRQPGTAKLDSLRIILHLTRDEIDLAIGLAPERRLAEQLRIRSRRTYELTGDSVTRHRKIPLPVLREDSQLKESQFLSGMVSRWVKLEAEYLGSFYPPHLKYVVMGENDTHAVPVAPPGTRVLVNTLLTQVRPSENVGFNERELYCVLGPNGITCSYLELTTNGKIILIPHPLSGRMREEFAATDVMVIGQVVGLLFQNEVADVRNHAHKHNETPG
ncbi:MAG TPA: hypothetical protein VIX17_17665 [Pyrinomonadaceae bacterium]|jgi:transcriptional regulator with XRE-family HTH domain